jgi:hypothetical protein
MKIEDLVSELNETSTLEANSARKPKGATVPPPQGNTAQAKPKVKKDPNTGGWVSTDTATAQQKAGATVPPQGNAAQAAPQPNTQQDTTVNATKTFPGPDNTQTTNNQTNTASTAKPSGWDKAGKFVKNVGNFTSAVTGGIGQTVGSAAGGLARGYNIGRQGGSFANPFPKGKPGGYGPMSDYYTDPKQDVYNIGYHAGYQAAQKNQPENPESGKPTDIKNNETPNAQAGVKQNPKQNPKASAAAESKEFEDFTRLLNHITR